MLIMSLNDHKNHTISPISSDNIKQSHDNHHSFQHELSKPNQQTQSNSKPFCKLLKIFILRTLLILGTMAMTILLFFALFGRTNANTNGNIPIVGNLTSTKTGASLRTTNNI